MGFYLTQLINHNNICSERNKNMSNIESMMNKTLFIIVALGIACIVVSVL